MGRFTRHAYPYLVLLSAARGAKSHIGNQHKHKNNRQLYQRKPLQLDEEGRIVIIEVLKIVWAQLNRDGLFVALHFIEHPLQLKSLLLPRKRNVPVKDNLIKVVR